MKQDHPDLSVRRQCSLLSLARSSLYYHPRGESAANVAFMEIIDRQFLETPWYGSRQMARHMRNKAISMNPAHAPGTIPHRAGLSSLQDLLEVNRFRED